MTDFNLPAPFLERMASLLKAEYTDFILSYTLPRTNGLRINTLKLDHQVFLSWPDTTVFSLRKIPWAKEGYYYDYLTQAGQHPWYKAGLYYLQEPSAMAPVEYLDPRPGERVLDLAAAPGGKSTQIAARLQGEGILWSNEIHPGRARILASNLETWGATNAIISQESPEALANRLPCFFDRVLLDAPCSGEGMFRKDPDAIREWSPEYVTACARRQHLILEQAAQMLKPGGRLVYSTCTFSKEENEEIILSFLADHQDFYPLNLPALDPNFVPCPELPGAFRLYPHRIAGEGHFIAVLERQDRSSYSCSNLISSKEKRQVKIKDKTEKRKNTKTILPSQNRLGEFLNFAQENLKMDWPAEGPSYQFFGDHLYYSPLSDFSLAGLTILRPGLHLGIIKPGRFQPGQGLAQSLTPIQVQQYLNLPLKSPLLKHYLGGESWASPGPQGWILVGIDQFPLGWAKRSQDELKNHYPKSLRLR